ncbi:MAG: LysM domain-containing protein [Aggregatilineales bacterium]
MKRFRLSLVIGFFTVCMLAWSPQITQASAGFGGAAQFTCADSEGQVSASGAARVSAGGSTIYAGYRQVSGNNQNPIMRSFGANNWCREDYETSSDDGRAYGLWWDGGTLYGVFSATGTGSGQNYNVWTGGGWLNSYGAGGGPRVAIILRLNPADGSPIGGTYISARLSNGNSNSVTVNQLQFNGGSLLVGIESAFSPRNTDRSAMSCTNYPLTWTLELSSNLGSAIGSAASNCTSSSPPPSITFGVGGASGVVGGAFIDGRLNARDIAPPIAIYCNAQGIAVYAVSPINSRGTLAFIASISQINTGVAQMRQTGRYATVASGDGATLYALTSNELQVNKFQINGTLYEFVFPLDACDSIFETTSVGTPTTTTTVTNPPPINLDGAGVHVVQAGETLYRIALRYGLTYPYLAQINGIAPPYTIYAGQTLVIPAN